MTVAFFGHRDADKNIGAPLYDVLNHLICNEGADTFYVGNQGVFDALVLTVLKDLKKRYTHIRCTVVLAYMPPTTPIFNDTDTLVPLALVNALPRFAIEKRNMWMLLQSDVVVTYVVRECGGAAKCKKKALLLGKRVIELGNVRPIQTAGA